MPRQRRQKRQRLRSERRRRLVFLATTDSAVYLKTQSSHHYDSQSPPLSSPWNGVLTHRSTSFIINLTLQQFPNIATWRIRPPTANRFAAIDKTTRGKTDRLYECIIRFSSWSAIQARPRMTIRSPHTMRTQNAIDRSHLCLHCVLQRRVHNTRLCD